MFHIPFKNQYTTLGSSFYAETMPTAVANPGLINFNEDLAAALNITTAQLDPNDLAAFFSGNRITEGSTPLAMAYAGHQFGNFVPQLGDGRAILLGDIVTSDGVNFDVQLKGSGPTIYSRNGDGRAALGPVLREYLVSEAMASLGVPTTRALAAVTTGEQVAREDLLPGGVITRVARSFVRVGTFQYFAARGDLDAVRNLADYVIEHNYPQLRDADNPYVALFKIVMDKQAALIAQWMQFGFIHGVMNTDNMSIAGETIDYGPCAFMDDYKHNKVFSSIDRNGRYAYNNQPAIGLWNLTRLAECLAPLFSQDEDSAVEVAKDILTGYQDIYEQYWLENMRAKLGLSTDVNKNIVAEDKVLIDSLLDLMEQRQADFTLTFFYLSQIKPGLLEQASGKHNELHDLFDNAIQLADWLSKWQQRLNHETISNEQTQANMQAVNPVYIPRNHQIEAAIRAAEDRLNFSVFHDLLEVLQNPFEQQKGKDKYMLPPQADEVVRQTFCGT